MDALSCRSCIATVSRAATSQSRKPQREVRLLGPPLPRRPLCDRASRTVEPNATSGPTSGRFRMGSLESATPTAALSLRLSLGSEALDPAGPGPRRHRCPSGGGTHVRAPAVLRGTSPYARTVGMSAAPVHGCLRPTVMPSSEVAPGLMIGARHDRTRRRQWRPPGAYGRLRSGTGSASATA
jgi:hypothetical protein